jgi:hypothetical protein
LHGTDDNLINRVFLAKVTFEHEVATGYQPKYPLLCAPFVPGVPDADGR